jgi:hypothetical protein
MSWLSELRALVVDKHETTWNGLSIVTGETYVIREEGERLRVGPGLKHKADSNGTGDLVFWKTSVRGLTEFDRRSHDCGIDRPNCTRTADSTGDVGWKCFELRRMDELGHEVSAGRCVIPKLAIGALYVCGRVACEGIRRIVLNALESKSARVN